MALAWKKLPDPQIRVDHSWEGLAAGNTLRVKRRRGLDGCASHSKDNFLAETNRRPKGSTGNEEEVREERAGEMRQLARPWEF